VKVNQWGGNRGVQDYTIRTGRVFFNPITEDIYDYPIFLQNYIFTQGKNEESPVDESLTFNSREGAPINADIGIGILIPAQAVPGIFVKYRQEAFALVHGPIRTLMRDSFIRHAKTMGVMEIMGARSSDLIDSVLVSMRHSLVASDSIHVEYISFLHRPRVAPEVEASITATITATQKAIEAQNMIVAATANARQQVEAARGDSLSNVIRAQGQAKANEVLNASITNDVLDWMRIQRWSGTLPLATGDGALPFLNLEKK
jgi:regulator of protease activity HflC (stomatin/prohibitin superfamily)